MVARHVYRPSNTAIGIPAIFAGPDPLAPAALFRSWPTLGVSPGELGGHSSSSSFHGAAPFSGTVSFEIRRPRRGLVGNRLALVNKTHETLHELTTPLREFLVRYALKHRSILPGLPVPKLERQIETVGTM